MMTMAWAWGKSSVMVRSIWARMLGGAAGQHQRRLARGQVDDAEVAPEHAGAEAGAERLRAGLLGSEALGVAGGAVGAAVGFLLLGLREDAIGEAGAEARQRPLDAADIDDVAADAEDHALLSPADSARALSMRARMRRMALSRPPKIASPTRKWPMFSSAMVAMAATGPTVSKVSPWPAWHSSPIDTAWTAAACSRRRWRARASPSASQ